MVYKALLYPLSGFILSQPHEVDISILPTPQQRMPRLCWDKSLSTGPELVNARARA